jgi:dTDP-4-amino-4,6-dideoxygalactose transaminase
MNMIFTQEDIFYPSLDTLDYIDPTQCCEISRDIASRVLCLPMYPELTTKQQKLIIKIIKNEL